MLSQKKLIFITKIKVVLEQLNSEWFEPNKKTPDGLHYYACTYCDMECGGHNNHDHDCLAQMAKNTLEAWNRIDIDNQYDLDYKKKLRLMKDILSLKEWAKYNAIFEHFIIDVQDFVPLDYSEPANEGVICTCCIFDGTGDEDQHDPKCPYVQVSQALSELFKV